jgi:hypothetical protein
VPKASATLYLTFADLGYKKRPHSRARAATQRMSDLKALQTIAPFGFAAHHIQYLINELGTFSIMALRPIVTGARLAVHEVVRAEHLAKRAGAYRVHRARLEIH